MLGAVRAVGSIVFSSWTSLVEALNFRPLDGSFHAGCTLILCG